MNTGTQGLVLSYIVEQKINKLKSFFEILIIKLVLPSIP